MLHSSGDLRADIAAAAVLGAAFTLARWLNAHGHKKGWWSSPRSDGRRVFALAIPSLLIVFLIVVVAFGAYEWATGFLPDHSNTPKSGDCVRWDAATHKTNVVRCGQD